MPNDSDNLPPELLRRMRSLHPHVLVPRETDDAVLAAARRTLPSLRRRWRNTLAWRVGGVTVAAAIAGGSALLLTVGGGEPSYERPTSTADARDVTGDGMVDVLDAFVVARGIEIREIQPAWDFDRDGSVMPADAEAIAADVVRLDDVREARGGA